VFCHCGEQCVGPRVDLFRLGLDPPCRVSGPAREPEIVEKVGDSRPSVHSVRDALRGACDLGPGYSAGRRRRGFAGPPARCAETVMAAATTAVSSTSSHSAELRPTTSARPPTEGGPMRNPR